MTVLSTPYSRHEACERLARLVGHDKRVLLVGRETATLASWLQAAGCSVVVVEMATQAATGATHSERLIVGDIEQMDLVETLGDDSFDVVIIADALEHVKDPLTVLTALKRTLRPQGCVVASILNVAHANVRLALLNGQFPYSHPDAPGHTQLQFYTHASVETLFEQAGLAIGCLERQTQPVAETDIPPTAPPELLGALAQDPEALTYQFILTAYPMVELTPVALRHQMRELGEATVATRRELAALRETIEDRPNRVRYQPDLEAALKRLESLPRTDWHTSVTRRITDPDAARRHHVQYQAVIHRIYGIVRAALPTQAIVVVVSKGDDKLLDLDGREGWHFPQTESGAYAGHYPADSSAAIAHLEALRRRGAEYLLFPAPALWWLDHYTAFKTHLERHYRTVVLQEDTCVIYALHEGEPGR